MVRHVRKRHHGAIVRGRQIAIVDRAEPFAARAAKIKPPDRSGRLSRKCIQEPKPIQYPLAIRLQQLSAQSLRRSRRPLQYQ